MESISRRSFVSILGSALAVVTGSKAFGATKPAPKKKKKPAPKKTTPPSVETLTPVKANNKTVSLEGIPVGESLLATYLDPKTHIEKTVVMHRTNATTVVAFSAICTHRGCTVEISVPTSFDCPCHGSSYNSQTGGVVTGPATRALTPLVVKIKEGALLISSN